jgi:choline monooxygenase
MPFSIDPNINSASTLPGYFYTDKEVFNSLKERVFERSWQFVTEEENVKIPGDIYPFSFLKGFIEEPLILTRDQENQLHCLSNVCTHRANLLIKNPCNAKSITCSYHGKRFDLKGRYKSMPESEGMTDFPSQRDHLPNLEIGRWKQFIFTSINPAFSFEALIGEMDKIMSFFPVNEMRFDSDRSQDYLVKANWALYCDNYLEGFHIPFIHPELNAAIDYKQYKTEIFSYSNLQTGNGTAADSVFELPAGHPDHGKNVAAYYFWLFPNIMFNFYPWGLSMNIIRPIEPELTKVSYRTYVFDSSKMNRGAGSALEKVEREDQNIVENVQKGIKSKLYNKGRFSPKMEKGPHHFHYLLSRFLSNESLI